MENPDRKSIMDESAAEGFDGPSLMDKLRTAQEAYGEDGVNPNPEMYEYTTKLIDRIARARKTENRAAQMRRNKRRAAKQSRKKNRRR